MSGIQIITILNELAATSSRLEKEAILTREKDNELLQRVMVATYNPFINYYQSKIDWDMIDAPLPVARPLDEALDELQSMKHSSSHASRTALANLAQSVHIDDSEVLERIIERDLKCGVQVSTINKIWPGLIPTFDVMLAHKDISGIKFPCYGQVKFDGARCHLYWDGVRASATSRNGKEYQLLGVFDSTFKTLGIPAGTTLDGELLVVATKDKTMTFADRKTGNGILNKATKGTITKEDADKVIFMCWDVVDFTSTIPYSTRIDKATVWIDGKPHKGVTDKNVFVVDTVEIKNHEDAQEYFEKCLAHGHEGAMMKNKDHVWVPKRSKDLGKMKAEEVADLIVVDIEEGTGKNKGKLGALVCETADGLLRVNVGTGLNDAERATFVPGLWVGRVVEVMYNQVITSKGKDTASLFLPRYMGTRFDKNVANNFGDLK